MFCSLMYLKHLEHYLALVSALVSCGYCNKLPHSWWLKTTHIYSLNNSEGQMSESSFTRSKSKCGQSFQRLWGGCFLCLLASGGCRHCLACCSITLVFKANVFRSLHIFSSVCQISLRLPFIKT